jgi:formate hydrogenlyase subunit 3/multisubunit Na+/H+ antiporter MnhD subunit
VPPTLTLAVPVALPLAAGIVAAACGAAGWRVGRFAAAAGAWAAIAALLALWIPARSSEELALGPLGFGAGFDLRLDAVAVTFGLIILAPAAVLLTLQARSWQDSTTASLALAAAVLAVEAGDVLLTAVAGCTAATLAVILLGIEDVRAPRPAWPMLLAAWLALAGAGVTLQVQGGTAVYDALPVAAFTPSVFLLVALSAIVTSGLFPWRPWPSRLWTRTSLRGAGMTAATLVPLGLYLLVRAYEMGDGRYPQGRFNIAVVLWGVLVALGAAARAQAAATRRDYLAEVIPGLAGFALMSVGVGTALGVVGAVSILATMAALAACLALLPDRPGLASLAVIAAAAGLPPGLAFGARVLGLTAAFEAGDAIGMIGIAGAATWLLTAAAAARSVRLPYGRARPAGDSFPRVAIALAALAMVAGPLLAVVSVLALPVAADVMSVPAEAGRGGLTSVVTVSTLLPAVALFVPLLVLLVLALAVTRGAAGPTRAGSRAPLFQARWSVEADRLRQAVKAAHVPEQYRSLANPSALEAALAGGRPILWLAMLGALAIAVNR